MDLAAVVLNTGSRLGGARARSRHDTAVVAAALAAGCDPTVVMVSDPAAAVGLPEGATAILDEAIPASEASALRAGVDWSLRNGANGVIVALNAADPVATSPASWSRLAHADGPPILLATNGGQRVGLVRLDAGALGVLPIEGPLAALWERHPELVGELALDASGSTSSSDPLGSPGLPPSAEDVASVTALLGRVPSANFRVALRDRKGQPVVIENAPFLADGTPMPTRYWLVGEKEQEAVGRLESGGGVARAEQVVPAEELARAHERYATSRDATIPADHIGPRPTGGVGGTRRGVKCLHAHLAWYLVGGGDPVGRFVAAELVGELDGPVAAVDCGTNSTRLLVADSDGRTLERAMTITRLGEGVDEFGRLADGAIERTLAALCRYREVMDRHGVVHVRAVATSAARDALNAEVFFSRVEQAIGVRPELLTGEEEGRIAYRGATAALDPIGGPYLVADIGGGSTELIAGPTASTGAAAAVVSLDVGCVRVTERFLSSDPPTPEQIVAARNAVAHLVDGATTTQPALRVPKRLVGVAGTVSTLAHLQLELESYDAEAVHELELSREQVEGWLERLASETTAERRRRPAIEPGRADVIVGGTLVLAELMGNLGFESLICSESDILDGLVAELLVSA